MRRKRREKRIGTELAGKTMPFSPAMAQSPVFSPSRISIPCKGSLSLSISPLASPCSHPCPPSPFGPRFQRVGSGLREIGAGVASAFSSGSILLDNTLPSSPSLISNGRESLLKRRRPARISIPLAGALTLTPEVPDTWKDVEAESAYYAVYCKRGKKRREMEDRHKAALALNGDSHLSFFGIFDGHEGKRAAEFASENMAEFIIGEVLSTSGSTSIIDVEEAVKIGYLKTNAEFLKEDVAGGACCVTALVRDGHLIVSNAGDCRAVLSRAGKAEALTADHRPSREDERNRIESLGGYVYFFKGAWRLQGSLAVSRGIGDSHLKPWVIPEPETKIISIEAECEFLILASDGLWDKVSNQEAVDTARSFLINAADGASLIDACKKLVDLSTARGSLDDTSVMIVKLEQFV